MNNPIFVKMNDTQELYQLDGTPFPFAKPLLVLQDPHSSTKTEQRVFVISEAYSKKDLLNYFTSYYASRQLKNLKGIKNVFSLTAPQNTIYLVLVGDWQKWEMDRQKSRLQPETYVTNEDLRTIMDHTIKVLQVTESEWDVLQQHDHIVDDWNIDQDTIEPLVNGNYVFFVRNLPQRDQDVKKYAKHCFDNYHDDQKIYYLRHSPPNEVRLIVVNQSSRADENKIEPNHFGEIGNGEFGPYEYSIAYISPNDFERIYGMNGILPDGRYLFMPDGWSFEGCELIQREEK